MFPCCWVYTVINKRMFHQEPDEIMVQLNQVYIYKLWDMCTLLNTHNSGELTVPGVSREASRFRAGVSLCAVLMDSHELKKLGVFYSEDRRSRNPGFLFMSVLLNLLWLLHSGGKSTRLFIFNNCISNVDFTSNDDDVKWCSVIAEFRFFLSLNLHGFQVSGLFETWLWFY